jgi:hypothetical protein
MPDGFSNGTRSRKLRIGNEAGLNTMEVCFSGGCSVIDYRVMENFSHSDQLDNGRSQALEKVWSRMLKIRAKYSGISPTCWQSNTPPLNRDGGRNRVTSLPHSGMEEWTY